MVCVERDLGTVEILNVFPGKVFTQALPYVFPERQDSRRAPRKCRQPRGVCASDCRRVQ